MSRPFHKESFDQKWKLSETGCWEWQAVKNQDGYGRVKRFGKLESAHRVSYELYKGPLNGLRVLHKCDNPGCINPDHLFLGTQKENIEDMIQKGRNRPTTIMGESHYNSKLSELDVLAIYSDTLSQSKIGRKYGVTQSCVSAIKSGRTWKHVTQSA